MRIKVKCKEYLIYLKLNWCITLKQYQKVNKKENNKLASSLVPHASLLFDNDIQNEWNGMH